MSQFCPATKLHNLFLVASAQINNFLKCILTFFSCLNDRRQKKDNPLIQVIALTHKSKRVIIRSFVSFKEIRKVKRWFSQNSKFKKMKSDEHTTDSSVAIIEGVNCLKLIMRNSHLNQMGHIQSFVVPKKFKVF